LLLNKFGTMDLQSSIDNDNVWFDDDIKAIDRGREIANSKWQNGNDTRKTYAGIKRKG